MRAAAEERGLDAPAIFMRLAALYMAGAPIGQEAEALGIPRGARIIDGAANNVRQLQRAAARNRGYELTNDDRLTLLEFLAEMSELERRFSDYRAAALQRSLALGSYRT